MKNIFITISLIFAFGLGLSAQGLYSQTDGFFSRLEPSQEYREVTEDLPMLPNRGLTENQYSIIEEEVPVGSGLLLLLSMGAGYMISKRRKE